MYKGLLLLCFCFAGFFLFAQKKNASYEIHIRRAAGPIHIDGVLGEAAWKQAEVAGNFYMILPMDTSMAKVRTDVRMTYDDHFLYLSAVCFDTLPGPYMVESVRRDWNFVKNDNFIFFLDPFDDQTNGFTFGTNAAGGQWDGTMYEGGKVDLSWAPVPRQFPSASLAYTGVLVWDTVPSAPGTNISLIPYLQTRVEKSYSPVSSPVYKTAVGGDAKISITSSLNLDLTVNPDFSQVEVDKQMINLNRYELFYPSAIFNIQPHYRIGI